MALNKKYMVGATALVSTVALSASAFAVVAAPAASADPTATLLSVLKGSAEGGTVVTITGAGYNAIDNTDTDAITVRPKSIQTAPLEELDEAEVVASKFIRVSDTQIVAVLPEVDLGGASSVVYDVIIREGGTVTSYNSANVKDDFTYIAPLVPSFAAVVQTPALGGGKFDVTVPTIATAADLTAKKLTATLNGVAAPLAFKAANTLTVTAPAGNPGFGKFVLLTDGVPAASVDDKVKVVGTISGLSAVTGPVAGGANAAAIVTVTGKGFTDAGTANVWKVGTTTLTKVSVAPAAKGEYQVVNDTTVKVWMPVSPILDAADAPVAGAVSLTFTTDADDEDNVFSGLTSKATYTYSDLG
jgi:hypothetical protein